MIDTDAANKEFINLDKNLEIVCEVIQTEILVNVMSNRSNDNLTSN